MIAEHQPAEQWQTRGKKNGREGEREKERKRRTEGGTGRETKGGGEKVIKFDTFFQS